MSEGPLAGVLAAARAAPRRGSGAGLLVMLAAARRGEGVSTIAREAAIDAGAPTLLIDLDLKRNPQAAYFATHGGLGAARDGRIGRACLARACDAAGAPLAGGLQFYPVKGAAVHVSKFEAPSGARIQMARDGGYWNALRAAGALTVIDAPALDRNELALTYAPFMDAVVLVVAGEAGAAPPAMAARAALAKAGAHVAGLVFARASASVLSLDQWTRRAG